MSAFKPFSDRLSRDIRNGLSESFLLVVSKGLLAPAQKIADFYLQETDEECYHTYITDRLAAYKRVLQKLTAHTDDIRNIDPLLTALLLWDEALFFEVHEVLEIAWLQKRGEQKLFLQAMIRAAGVYIKIESGQLNAAASMAGKALAVLTQNSGRLTEYTDPTILTEALSDLSRPAPKLMAS